MKRFLFAALALAVLPGAAQGLTLNLDAELLKAQLGYPMQIGGLVVLTAATQGNFSGPTPTSFASGTEVVLDKWDLSAFATPGVFSDTTGDLGFFGDWNPGDPLRLYWYPTLDLSATAPGAGTGYGTYTDLVGIDGSAPWITGAAGDTLSLKFFTHDAAFLNAGGSNPAAAGLADLAVAPEPGTALFGLAMLAMAGWKRRRIA
jgi:hypothetical protein